MPRLDWQALVAGVGGQGVLFVTRLLAQAAMDTGSRVLISEVHGMAQRGGSVVSHLKAGCQAGPLLAQGQADLLLSLDSGEAVRNLAYLAPNAALVVNAPGPEFLSKKARAALRKQKVRLITLDASGIAAGLGSPKGLNVVMAAAAARAGALPFSPQKLEEILTGLSPRARRKPNQRLFAAGQAAIPV